MRKFTLPVVRIKDKILIARIVAEEMLFLGTIEIWKLRGTALLK
jgi:hypothetical protein